jgi:hypothetical protein
LPEGLLGRLEEEASAAGTTVTALVTELLTEGLDLRRFRGLVYRDGPTGRRVALVGGPDVWEVIRDLRHLEGDQGDRVQALSTSTGVAPAMILQAIDFYGASPAAVDERIAADEAAASRTRLRLDRRAQLFAS